MRYLIFLFIIGITLIYNYRINKSIGYPPFLYSLIWFVVIFLHFLCIQFDLVVIYELSFGTLLIYSVGVILFTLGGIIGRPKNKMKIDTNKISYFKISNRMDIILILITLVFLPFFILSSYQLAVEYMIFDSLYAGLRNAAVQEQDVGFPKYGTNFAYISFFIQVYQYIQKKNNKLKLLISTLILLIFCILSTGRTFFIIFLCLIFGVLIVYQRLKPKYLFYGFVSIILLFSVVGILLNKGGSVDNNLGENVNGLWESFLIYFVGGLSAFDIFINSEYTLTYGENSFRFLGSMFNKLGYAETTTISLVDDYVSVPFDTNVYTVYKIYFEDFGFFFMMMMILLVSIAHTNFYYKAMNQRKMIYTFLYSIMLYPLIMSFFQEQYLSLIPTWIYLIVILMMLKPFVKEKLIKRD